VRVSGTAKAIVAVLAVIAFVSLAQAQGMSGGAAPMTGMSAKAMPSNLKDVGIDQKLNSQVPLDLSFRDESGQAVTLRKYFTGRPVILSLVYFNCPMLCPDVVMGMTKSLNLVKLDMGKDYDVLTVSFDPKDTPTAAAEKKREWLDSLDSRDDRRSWHFLTGDQQAISALTQAVGFRYVWDPENQQFAHATGIMVLTPEGRVSKYFYGADYSPTDLRFGLIEASNHKIGTLADQVLLFCCKYNVATGRYDLLVSRLLAIAAAITIIVLGSFLLVMFRVVGRKKKQANTKAAA
jgi:protein SCO1/2